MKKLWVVCPCYFDVDLFSRVKAEVIESVGRMNAFDLRFLLIDDTGGQDPQVKALSSQSDTKVLTVPYNMGHQAALVYGLRKLGSEIKEEDFILTMDSDGEDRPVDVEQLLKLLVKEERNLCKIAIARRSERREALLFKLMYMGFKTMFWFLAGTVIRSGNFVAYRGWFLKEVIFHPHFDQCYASSFMSLPLQVEFIPLPRGPRYGGKSRMGYMGLITHGVRMLMPFTERIAIRGMMASGIFTGLSTVALALCLSCPTHKSFGALVCFFSGLIFLGLFALLFTTFSQTKSRSLRASSER